MDNDPAFDKYIGKKVKAIWFDDPEWYEGIITKDENGHLVNSQTLKNNGCAGYLEMAFDFQLIG